MKKNEKNNLNIKNKNSRNIINENKKIIPHEHQKSMNNFYIVQKNENIIPIKRKTKSREKETKEVKIFPLIKKYSFNSKSKKNNIPKPTNLNIKNKDININILPNLNQKKKISNNIKNKNEINNNIMNKIEINNNLNIINNSKLKEMKENAKNMDLIKDINKDNLDTITKFYEEFIELSNSISNKNLFISLLNNFNKKYLLHYSTNTYINQIDDKKFIECLKYSFILIASLIFLSKDEASHKFNCQRLKELVDQFIVISLKNIKLLSPSKIKIFINRIKPTKKSLTNSINSIIKLLYNNKNEYNTLKSAFNQLITSINSFNINDIINILNNSILYCYNHQNLKLFFNYANINNNKEKINKKKKNKSSKNINVINPNEEMIPSAPFIKTKMTKKFCLVLDIDETITHTLKLPFGDYFLVRPGVKDFLEEMIKYYEIVIFTSSPKTYADNILDKIDINNEFFSYRLYRRHVIFENGNSVKKLDMIGRDLKKIVFVDNLKSNAKYNPDNLYHIKSWLSDINDNQLIILKNKLKDIATSGNYDNDITKGLCNI